MNREALMKWIRAVVSLLLAAAIFWGFDNRHGMVPPAGKLLNPFAGFWQNGTRGDSLPADLAVPGLRDEVRVAWDGRHVPHIFARNDHDLYLAQGYISAYLRLWQMEFELLYSAGRISEIVGPMGIQQDRFNRRFGMVWAAENALNKFRDDPKTREAVAAYSAGVNDYIRSLGRKNLPLEYKILDYEPEPWTELKCALLLKSMAYVLASYNQDAAMTVMRKALGEPVMSELFPYQPPLVSPVIPPGTAWDFTPVPLPNPKPQGDGGSKDEISGRVFPDAGTAGFMPIGTRPSPDVGSNNWAVSGRLTRSGSPILCNDMHLGLTLPAVWYEVQLAAPGLNARGVSFPGAPLIIAGYNENIAWGFTNGTDDVLDWYAVKFRDESRGEYLYDGQWRKTSIREERIKVRGGRDVIDKVLYTHQGPVVRLKGEANFPADVPEEAALRWLAHDPSNEFMTIDGLGRAKNYADYLKALEYWDCPSQNIIFADREGTIAIWHSGKYPLRWKGQGRYVLDGSDPADNWQGWVPRAHNPHVKDPERGFVSSANQMAADARYPYYLGWDYASYERGARINEILGSAKGLTPEDMIRMQADVLDLRARAILPRVIGLISEKLLTETARRSLDELRSWNFESRAGFIAPTIFKQFWNDLNALTWDDEKKGGMARMTWPASQVMVDLILNHPGSEFFDDRTTPEREGLADIADRAFREAVAALEKRWGPFGPAWKWGKTKGTRIRHLAEIPGLGLEGLEADGDSVTIDAISMAWAPSWRMIVELGPEVKAWGIYPGGQSGNPGSKFYDDMVEDWLSGKPDELVFLKSAEEPHPGVVARTTMRGGK
jgi:penicillin amidase